MSSRIEQIIEEIEEFVESCKYQPLSTTKIVVNKEELEELLRELRLKTPDEIKRYQKIISNKDAILADAQSKADGLIAEAQAKVKEMVSQHEVMQQAYAQANETIANANKQAQQILDGTIDQADASETDPGATYDLVFSVGEDTYQINSQTGQFARIRGDETRYATVEEKWQRYLQLYLGYGTPDA